MEVSTWEELKRALEYTTKCSVVKVVKDIETEGLNGHTGLHQDNIIFMTMAMDKVLDLNGHTINAYVKYYSEVLQGYLISIRHKDARLTIRDSVGGGALIGKFNQEFYYQFIDVDEGTLVMESGTVKMLCPSNDNQYKKCAVSVSGTAIFNGGEVLTQVTSPCVHGSFTPVPEKASNCTEKGWDAYKKCTVCNKLFDMSGNLLSGIPYRALNDNHDLNTSEWGYKEADGHAHVCRRNAEHRDVVQPHTPDHEGGATYEYAVKCTECGRVLEPQLEAGDIRIEVPFKLTVKKTGEMDPGKETFKFVVERFGAPVEYVLVQDTVETEGEKTYDGKFIFTIKADQVHNLSEGFVIRQVKGDTAGWTYDETKFYAMHQLTDNELSAWAFFGLNEDERPDMENPIGEIGFTNSYNAKKFDMPPAPQEPDTPPVP